MLLLLSTILNSRFIPVYAMAGEPLLADKLHDSFTVGGSHPDQLPPQKNTSNEWLASNHRHTRDTSFIHNPTKRKSAPRHVPMVRRAPTLRYPSFGGNPATVVRMNLRPVALRPHLSMGLPLSPIDCQGETLTSIATIPHQRQSINGKMVLWQRSNSSVQCRRSNTCGDRTTG